MEQLAAKLSDRFGGAQAFFCNSGAEAIEAALKWARKATGRDGVVALEGSFHGRTIGALSVTGQPAKRAAFEPLVPGARFATPETLAEHVGPNTAAILLEPVQGEGGVHPLAPETLARGARARRRARRAADPRRGADRRRPQRRVLRVAAATACSPTRSTLAKGLANGLPIGALLVADDAPTGFEPGDHASTFGGNPVACAAACAVVDTIDDALLAHVREHLGAASRRARRVRRRARARPAARGRARPPGRHRSSTAALEHGLVSAPPARTRFA